MNYLILLATLFFTVTSHADLFYLRPTESKSLTASDLTGIDEIIKMSAEKVKNLKIATNENQASMILEPRIAKIGSAYIFSVKKIKNGTVLFQQQARASNLEDMDTVALRVLRAVVNQKDIAADSEVTDVTEDQLTRGSKRIGITAGWFFGIGPGLARNLNTEATGVNATLGYNFAIHENASLNLGWQYIYFNKTSAAFNSLYMGGDYFFTGKNTSPFLSAAFGYGGASAHDGNTSVFHFSKDSASGWNLQAGAGLMFFRAYKMNMSVSARWLQFFDKTSYGPPGLGILNMTFYF